MEMEYKDVEYIKVPSKIEPWHVTEQSFSDEHSLLSESIFCLANERMGCRGGFEEGYSGTSTPGSYFGGIYETIPVHHVWWMKGNFPEGMDFIVNAMHWISLAPSLENERFDMARSMYSNYERTLDMRTGLLSRKLIWTDSKGHSLKLYFERFGNTFGH